jgi:uncharacterized tellurite resistance protein B-like protein
MFGNWLRRASNSEQVEGAERLQQALRAELPDMDEESVLIITAIVGLLGAVAYADTEFSEVEMERVRDQLSRVEGLSSDGVRSVCQALREHVVEVSTVQLPRYSRVLRELADRDLRFQVVEMLMNLADADEVITSSETNTMRQITSALGLTQRDYNAIQQRYREHLKVLK